MADDHEPVVVEPHPILIEAFASGHMIDPRLRIRDVPLDRFSHCECKNCKITWNAHASHSTLPPIKFLSALRYHKNALYLETIDAEIPDKDILLYSVRTNAITKSFEFFNIVQFSSSLIENYKNGFYEKQQMCPINIVRLAIDARYFFSDPRIREVYTSEKEKIAIDKTFDDQCLNLAKQRTIEAISGTEWFDASTVPITLRDYLPVVAV